jgi:hypothetical protein
VPPPTAIDRDLTRLESELKRLEAEYNMFFSGRSSKPPLETRGRVAALVKQFDRQGIKNTGDRMRFETIQARYNSYIDLWDRALRAREEGRPGPFMQQKKTGIVEPPKPPPDRIFSVTSFRDPVQESDKMRELYESLAEAKREIGEDVMSFDRFAEVVKHQVIKLKDEGNAEVAFRVAVKDGKVNLTARALKG